MRIKTSRTSASATVLPSKAHTAATYTLHRRHCCHLQSAAAPAVFEQDLVQTGAPGQVVIVRLLVLKLPPLPLLRRHLLDQLSAVGAALLSRRRAEGGRRRRVGDELEPQLVRMRRRLGHAHVHGHVGQQSVDLAAELGVDGDVTLCLGDVTAQALHARLGLPADLLVTDPGHLSVPALQVDGPAEGEGRHVHQEAVLPQREDEAVDEVVRVVGRPAHEVERRWRSTRR